MENRYPPIKWKDGTVLILDQRRLPEETIYHEYREPDEVLKAIKDMVVRGAPAIGITAGYAMALASLKIEKDRLEFDRELKEFGDRLKSARPTAVNLFWAVDRVLSLLKDKEKGVEELKKEILEEADKILKEEIEQDQLIGKYGAELLPKEGIVLTHCNAGGLATGGIGTALGVIKVAVRQGKKIEVIVDETRPYLQGARLTAWELMTEGIPVTVIADNMAGFVMAKKRVSAVIIGADRIVANGDTANKIGSYSLAILAKYHDIPFYVAAPSSSFDLSIERGDEIPIEFRKGQELIYFNNRRIVPEGVKVFNPAFDIVPSNLITAIITEKGIIKPPFKENIQKILG